MTANIPELLQILPKLGKVDSLIAGILAERKRVEKSLADKDKELKKAESEVASKKKLLKERQSQYQKDENELTNERDKLVSRRKALTTLNNYKVQQAAEKEIELAAKALNSREDTLLGGMEEIEKLEKEVAVQNDKGSELRAAFLEFEKESLETFKTLEERLARQQETRRELTQHIDAPTLSYYEKIRERFPQNPVVESQKGTCSGCFMQLGPQNTLKIARAEALIRCPGCGRILFLSDSKEE